MVSWYERFKPPDAKKEAAADTSGAEGGDVVKVVPIPADAIQPRPYNMSDEQEDAVTDSDPAAAAPATAAAAAVAAAGGNAAPAAAVAEDTVAAAADA